MNNLALLGKELITRPYLTLGIISWVILLALAFTSTRAMQRKLGKHWQQLHNFVYLVAIPGPNTLSVVSEDYFTAAAHLRWAGCTAFSLTV